MNHKTEMVRFYLYVASLLEYFEKHKISFKYYNLMPEHKRMLKQYYVAYKFIELSCINSFEYFTFEEWVETIPEQVIHFNVLIKEGIYDN